MLTLTFKYSPKLKIVERHPQAALDVLAKMEGALKQLRKMDRGSSLIMKGRLFEDNPADDPHIGAVRCPFPSLSHACTRTLSLFLCLSFCISLYLACTRTRTHAHTRAYTLSLSSSLTLSHSLSFSLSLPHSHLSPRFSAMNPFHISRRPTPTLLPIPCLGQSLKVVSSSRALRSKMDASRSTAGSTACTAVLSASGGTAAAFERTDR